MSILYRIRWLRVSLAAAAVGALTWWSGTDAPISPKDGPPGAGLMVNRVWIDHLPRSERDLVNHLVFVDQDGDKLGAVARSSRWRHMSELFRWKKEEDGVTLRFPQNDRKVKMKTRAYECKGSAPDPFELCLDVTVLKRKVVLYSMKQWRVEGVDDTLADLPLDPGAEVDAAGIYELLTLD